MRSKKVRLRIECLEPREVLTCPTGVTCVDIDQNFLNNTPGGPWVLSGGYDDPRYTNPQPYEYDLQTDAVANGTAFVIGNSNVTLNLNNHNVTYDNRPMLSSMNQVPNGDFEDSTLDHWTETNSAATLSLASTADVMQTYGSHAMHGSQMLHISNLDPNRQGSSEVIQSDLFPLPNTPTDYEYAATISVRSYTSYAGSTGTPHDATLKLDVLDQSGNTLGTNISTLPSAGFSPVAVFTAHSGQMVRLVVTASPAYNGSTYVPTTMDIDWAEVRYSRNTGIMASSLWIGGQPAQLRGLAGVKWQLQTNFTLENTAGLGNNGQIVQGAGHSHNSPPVDVSGLPDPRVLTPPAFSVSGITAVVNQGADTQNLFADGSMNGTITSSRFTGALERISNRQHIYAAISVRDSFGTQSITNNDIEGTSHVGIVYDWNGRGDVPSSVVIDGNTIRQDAWVTDGYGINISGAQNFEIAYNDIEPVHGRGILLDNWAGSLTMQNGAIHDNTVSAFEAKNLEYGNQLEATALRIRDRSNKNSMGQELSVMGNISIFNNSFTAYSDYVSGSVVRAMGTRISKSRSLIVNSMILPLVVRNNTFRAYVNTADPSAMTWNSGSFVDSYNATAMSIAGCAPGTGLYVLYNVLKSDDTSLNFADNDDPANGTVSGAYLIGNTVLWDQTPGIVYYNYPPASGGYAAITGGWAQNAVINNSILNTIIPSNESQAGIDTTIWNSRHNGTQGTTVPNTITWQTPPEVDGMGNVVVFGISAADNQVYFEIQAGGQWSPWTLTQLSPNGVNGFTSIARMMDSTGLPLLAAIGTDGQVYSLSSSWNSQLGLQWNNWTLTTSTSNGPVLGIAAVTDNNGNQNIYAIQNNHNVYSETFVNGQWGPWHLTKALYMQAISATTDATGVAEIYGIDQNSYVETQKYLGTAWSDWSLTNTYTTVKAISAVTDSTGTVWVFATGRDDDVYYEYFDGSNWNGWTKTVATTHRWNPISVGVDLNGNLIVFGRSDDGQIYEETESGGQWSWLATSYWADRFLAVA